MADIKSKTKRRTWLKDPTKPRKGEVIGGGFFVFRRGDRTGRIRPKTWPFEHASFDAATTEAQRLSNMFPGEKFVVIGQQGEYLRGDHDH